MISSRPLLSEDAADVLAWGDTVTHSYKILPSQIGSRGRDMLVKLTLAFNLLCFFRSQQVVNEETITKSCSAVLLGAQLDCGCNISQNSFYKKGGAPGWCSEHCAIHNRRPPWSKWTFSTNHVR